MEYEIENSDLITILGSAGTKDMMYIHVQTRVYLRVSILVKLPRSRCGSFSRSDFGIRASVSKVFEENYSQNHPERPSSHGSPIADDRGCDDEVMIFHPCPELFCSSSKSSDWSQSLISWSLEELEGSISAQGTFRARCEGNY